MLCQSPSSPSLLLVLQRISRASLPFCQFQGGNRKWDPVHAKSNTRNDDRRQWKIRTWNFPRSSFSISTSDFSGCTDTSAPSFNVVSPVTCCIILQKIRITILSSYSTTTPFHTSAGLGCGRCILAHKDLLCATSLVVSCQTCRKTSNLSDCPYQIVSYSHCTCSVFRNIPGLAKNTQLVQVIITSLLTMLEQARHITSCFIDTTWQDKWCRVSKVELWIVREIVFFSAQKKRTILTPLTCCGCFSNSGNGMPPVVSS